MRNMNLREARFKANQMTQAELFVKTGIDPSKISRIENGTAEPTVEEIKKIAKALKTKNIEYSLVS